MKIMREDFLTHEIRKWIKINEKRKLNKKTSTTLKFKRSSMKKLFSFVIKKTIAPNITGILKRLEYFTVKFLLKPKERSIIIFAPALLTPGTKAKHWNNPVRKASL